jgi:hypothetical protein
MVLEQLSGASGEALGIDDVDLGCEQQESFHIRWPTLASPAGGEDLPVAPRPDDDVENRHGAVLRSPYLDGEVRWENRSRRLTDPLGEPVWIASHMSDDSHMSLWK